MTKFFCISDVHSFYFEMVHALEQAGFDKDNEDHYLVCCGDFFDRGRHPEKIISYFNSIDRKIMIRGNHEDLFIDMYKRGEPRSHDYHNGTVETALNLSPIFYLDFDINGAIKNSYKILKPFINSMVDYFETKNYVFTHGWIPMVLKNGIRDYRIAEYRRHPDWRHASKKCWKDARWLNGMHLADLGYTIEKTVVVGHWHTSYGHHIHDGTPENGEGADYSIFYGNGIIAIDGCTALTRNVNVLVIEDDFMEEE